MFVIIKELIACLLFIALLIGIMAATPEGIKQQQNGMVYASK